MTPQNKEGRKKQRRFVVLPSLRFFLRGVQALALLFLQAATLPVANAQTVKDTFYYDGYWRICEKPVAAYYRTGELQLGKQWHFVNEVKDFYTGGGLEMTGRYSPQGSKNGSFTFYHSNGKIKSTGSFANDTMKGLWSYYDVAGELYFQVDCQNNQTFTPLFIKNPDGDTLLRNGTGRFAFKVLDYPDVFPVAEEYMVKGQCLQGRRTGNWTYDVFADNTWRKVADETYNDGIFSGGTFGYVLGGNELRQPAFIVALSIIKLLQTEAFAHDPVFGNYVQGFHTQQLEAFLLRGDVPGFVSGAKKFEANVLDYILLCAAAIGNSRLNTPNLFWQVGNIQSYKLNQDAWLVAYCLQSTNPETQQQSDLFPVEKLKAYNAHISFTVYEEGVTSDVSVKGNFEKDISTHMAYYLSRLTGLAPKREAGKAVAAQQHLYLYSKANTATYRKHSYIVYRLLLSLKPEEQTADNFIIADFAN